MTETPPIDLRPWEPGEGAIGFLLHPAVAGESPRLVLWFNPGSESYLHAQVSAAKGIKSEHIAAKFRLHPDYGSSVYPGGEIDGRTHEEWVVALDPRLSTAPSGPREFPDHLWDDDELQSDVGAEPAPGAGPATG